MFHFGSPRDEVTYGVLLNVSSASITVAIVESKTAASLPIILYTNETLLRTGTTESDLRRVREALLSIILTLSQEGLSALRTHNPHARIQKILVSCGAPWAHSVARKVSYENEEAFKVTEGILNDLVQSAEEEIHTYLEKEASALDDFVVVERATTDISINDYVVENPISKIGTTCGLSHMVGLIPKELLEALTEARDRLFPDTELVVHTSLLVSYCILRDLYPHTDAFTIIEVSGEATEFGIVEHNLLSQNKSFPYGSATFIRAIAKEKECPVSDAATLVAAQGKNHLTEDPQFETQVHTYTDLVRTCMQEMTQKQTLPRATVIIVHHSFTQIFKDMNRLAYLALEKTEPQIISLEEQLFHEVTPGIVCELPIVITSQFFHKLSQCGALSDT